MFALESVLILPFWGGGIFISLIWQDGLFNLSDYLNEIYIFTKNYSWEWLSDSSRLVFFDHNFGRFFVSNTSISVGTYLQIFFVETLWSFFTFSFIAVPTGIYYVPNCLFLFGGVRWCLAVFFFYLAGEGRPAVCSRPRQESRRVVRSSQP